MKKRIFLFAFPVIAITANAQSIEEQLVKPRISCYDVLTNAANVLPPLYDARSFDSLQAGLEIAQHYCDSSVYTLFFLQTLLSIQQSRFSVTDITRNENISDWLENYALSFDRYNGSYRSGRYYFNNAYNDQNRLSKLIRLWASDLLAAGKLGDNEALICNVLAGNIRNPQATIKANKQKYPELYASLHKTYTDARKHPDGNVAFVAGSWFPSGNAKLLGVHPQLGLQTGGRSTHNELDLTILIRFNRAANDYKILRQDSLYVTKHFLGGYIGLDYTRYIIHTTSFEMGVTAGFGWDGFDVMDSDKYKVRENDLEPYTIGSLNLNAGMRFNYYFNPNFFIGIGGRFNKLNYKNGGGTNLRGNAVSIDFFIGG